MLGQQRKETRVVEDQAGHEFTGLRTAQGFEMTRRINASGNVLVLRFER